MRFNQRCQWRVATFFRSFVMQQLAFIAPWVSRMHKNHSGWALLIPASVTQNWFKVFWFLRVRRMSVLNGHFSAERCFAFSVRFFENQKIRIKLTNWRRNPYSRTPNRSTSVPPRRPSYLSPQPGSIALVQRLWPRSPEGQISPRVSDSLVIFRHQVCSSRG